MDLITTGLVLSVGCAVLCDQISDRWEYTEHIIVSFLKDIIVYALFALAVFFFLVAVIAIGVIIVGVYLDMEVAVPSGILG